MKNNESEGKELRKVFCDTLDSLMSGNRDVVYLEADLAGAIGTGELFSKYPEQAFDMGIMEANMVGVGAGMSIRGKIPFLHSFGTFASRRCADQVFISGCYNQANIKIIGSDPGISAETNGGTHMPFEDMGIYRSFPGITILDVAEPHLLHAMMLQISQTYGVVYLRFPRKAKDSYYPESQEFSIGKGIVLREGTDATVIASGIEVLEALHAADMLASEGLEVQVVDMFTIKPIDTDLIEACARQTGAVVTAENHNKIGGLGSAVAEVLSENCPVPFRRIGVPDRFGEVGSKSFLADKFGISAENIVLALKEVIQKKSNSFTA